MLSEFEELFPDWNTAGVIQPLLHKGEWAIHEVLPVLLSLVGPSEVKIATFNIAEDSLRELFFLVDEGKITNLSMLLDTNVKRHKIDMLLFAMHITPFIRTDSNHAKILLVKNKDYSFGIVGSANLNQPRRLEAGFWFTRGDFFDFFTARFNYFFNEAAPYDFF